MKQLTLILLCASLVGWLGCVWLLHEYNDKPIIVKHDDYGYVCPCGKKVTINNIDYIKCCGFGSHIYYIPFGKETNSFNH